MRGYEPLAFSSRLFANGRAAQQNAETLGTTLPEEVGIKKSIPWGRLVLEATVVVGSVYLALALEGASAERGRRVEAVEALQVLRAELEQDRSDLREIIASQQDRQVRHQRIDRWLSRPESLPRDSVAEDFLFLFSVNRTLYPRSAAWSTMVSSGQFNDLDDAILVSELANFFENRVVRIVDNGSTYDQWVLGVARSTLPAAWDRIERRLTVRTSAEINRFRSELLGVFDFGTTYLGLLEAWGEDLDRVAAMIDDYLRAASGA